MDIEKINRETYLAWKADCEAKGKTPWELLEMVRPHCSKEYAEALEAFILKWEEKTADVPFKDSVQAFGTESKKNI